MCRGVPGSTVGHRDGGGGGDGKGGGGAAAADEDEDEDRDEDGGQGEDEDEDEDESDMDSELDSVHASEVTKNYGFDSSFYVIAPHKLSSFKAA